MNKNICLYVVFLKHQISVLILVLKILYQFGSEMKYFYLHHDLETLKEVEKVSCFFIYSWCFQQP